MPKLLARAAVTPRLPGSTLLSLPRRRARAGAQEVNGLVITRLFGNDLSCARSERFRIILKNAVTENSRLQLYM
jgi:hypothetical protein